MHQIGNTFTRLQPAIDFSGVVLQDDPTTPCVLGDPPARLAAVHSPALVNAWYAKLQSCLAEPVQVEQRKGHRRVQDLGTAIFDFYSDGTVQAYKWAFNEIDRPALVHMPDQTVVAQGVPYQSLWMNGFKEGALRALQPHHPGRAALCEAYVEWAHRELVSRCWGPAVQATVRERIATELALEPQLLEVASRIQRSAHPRVPVRLDAYNHVVKHRQDYLTLLQEAPQLIPLYALLADDLDEAGEVTVRMRTLLTEHGVEPATWRMLCRHGSAWLQEFLAFFDFEWQSEGAVAVDLLLMAQAFGSKRPVPPWLLDAALKLGGTLNAPNVNFAARLDDLFPLCARLGHLVAQADDASLALLKDRIDDIFNWSTDHLAGVPDRALRQASVKWLVRQVEAQALQEALQHLGAKSWDVPYRIDLGHNDVSAVILDSPLAVWQEGQAMHHCADNYIDRCANGSLLMVSLRSAQQHSPLATASFSMNGAAVQLKQISGFANRLVSPEMRSVAVECQRQLQAQRKAARAATQPERKAA